jgi:glycine C-acetyltransferase
MTAATGTTGAGRLDEELAAELAAMREAGTMKRLRVLRSPQGPEVELDGHGRVLVLSSNDYLGLAAHPDVVAAGAAALKRYGAGTASVRFICGLFEPHLELERDLAAFVGTEASLTYVSCWNANQALLDALSGPGTHVFSDELNHASIIDGIRLARPAGKTVFPHRDLGALARGLDAVPAAARKLIVTDGVFSMEGDLAPLPELAELARERDAVLIVDDSHGLGVLGSTGAGTPEHFGLRGEIDIVTGTIGKALGGGAGGFVAGSRALVEVLEQRSRPQLFSNGLPPTVAASARRALAELREHPGLLDRLRANTERFRAGLRAAGLSPLDGESAIVPIVVGRTALAIGLSARLLDAGVFVTGFGYPVVPEGAARIRAQISAALSDAQVDRAVSAIVAAARAEGIIHAD